MKEVSNTQGCVELSDGIMGNLVLDCEKCTESL